MKLDIRTYLKDNLLLFDGGMGTLCAQRVPQSGAEACEKLNLTHPEEILAIHREYRKAGCQALKTNTFGANRMTMPEDILRNVICAGWALAEKAAEGAYVFADIGPVSGAEGEQLGAEYRFVADVFLALGAKHFLFETNSVLDGLGETAAYIKSREPGAFIILSFASLPDGFTRSGQSAASLLKMASELDAVDAVGLNCASGARHTAKLVSELPELHKPLSVMPNAGYPTVLANRTYYDGDPRYFAHQIGEMAAHGAKILGGCCGTTPEHMACAAEALRFPRVPVTARKTEKAPGRKPESAFWQALCDPDRRPFAVELDSPEGAELEKYMAGAKTLKEHGASVITIADCPIARARLDASILACKLRRELDMDVIPHMTCRDRNLNATKALLLGLCAEGVHNVLAITGDPIPSASRDEVKSVYNFNSRMLAGYIRDLGEQALPTPFHVFGALNVNAPNFHVQLRLAREKEEKGVCGFLTQPILTPQAFENLKLARQELQGKLLGGIFPIVSYKNACFMNSEVSGVKVDEKIIGLYENLDREAGEDLAVEISREIAARISPYVDGFYLMTPFSRTALMGRIMDAIGE